MTAQDHQNRYGAVCEPAPHSPAFHRETVCDLCELWIAQCWRKWRVICVNFGRQAPREKRPVNCVNFGMSKATSHNPFFAAFFIGRQAYA